MLLYRNCFGRMANILHNLRHVHLMSVCVSVPVLDTDALPEVHNHETLQPEISLHLLFVVMF